MKKVENIPTEVINVCQDDYSWLTPSQNAMKSKECKRVLFVGVDGKKSGALGFTNCIRKEPDGQKAKCVLLMDTNVPAFSMENSFYQSQLSKDMAINVYQDGQWGTYRHLKLSDTAKIKCHHVYVNVLVRGDMSSLTWIQGRISDERYKNPEDRKHIVDVHYAALNFRDIMLASGKLAPEVISKTRKEMDCVIGFEYSGVLGDGRRIMGLLENSGLSSAGWIQNVLCWDVPEDWSLEDAATVPCTYGTALYSIIVKGKIKKGESILIHAGTGGVGQAAINISLALGCTVFTTVGTPEKRQFIRETFPQIDDRHIGNSRDTSFEQLVMYETNGRGVDVVLNSLAEEKLQASVRCLAKGGRFLEIGKFDLSNNNPLGMEIFAKGASFHGILLDSYFAEACEAQTIILNLLDEYIKNGVVKPLCRHIFDKDDVENAFRFMASGKHIGKVLIKVKEEAKEPNQISQPCLYEGVPRFYCKAEATYVIIGGLGGFGLELADWLVLRGATNVVLTSRTGIANGYQSYRINTWKSYNVNVKVLTDDVTTYDGVENILKTASSMGPVLGIFNLAVILRDGIFENQTEESFQTSLGPKAIATQYLDELSRKLCPDLKQFVIFSSVSCGRGNAGQTNYGMANSIMERICESRVAHGLPATAIQWGAVGDVGLVAEMMEDHVEMVIGGTLQQRITSCIDVMDQFLNQDNPIVASMVVAEKRLGRSSSDNIVDTVINILGIRDMKTVSIHSNLAELGMDSMMAVEIKQTLEREFEVFLSPQDIRGMTIAKLQEIAAAKDASEEKPVEDIIEEDNLEETEYLITVIAPETNTYETMIKLDSIATNSTEKKTRLIFLPGLEGFPICFESIAKLLDFEVYGCQLDYTTYHDDLNVMADYYLTRIVPYLIEKTYNLVGYSYGGILTLMIAQRLECMGYSGRIVLIDSAPEMMALYCRSTFSEKADDNLQVQVIKRLIECSIRSHVKLTEIENLLRETPDWSSRVELIVNAAKHTVSLSENYMRHLFNSGYNRVKALYKEFDIPEKCISSPVTLIRPTTQWCQINDDYNLSKYCIRPVDLHYVEGDHLTVLSNKKTAHIISDVFMSEETLNSKASLLRPPTDIGVISEPTKHI